MLLQNCHNLPRGLFLAPTLGNAPPEGFPPNGEFHRLFGLSFLALFLGFIPEKKKMFTPMKIMCHE